MGIDEVALRVECSDEKLVAKMAVQWANEKDDETVASSAGNLVSQKADELVES